MLKKTWIIAASIGMAAFLLNTVHAEDQHYVGGNFWLLDYSEEGIDDDLSLTAIAGRLGTELNENFSVEARAGIGIGDDSASVSIGGFNIDADLELDNFFGGYLRGGIPITESFFPYVALGFTRVELTVSVPGYGSESDSGSDFSYGLGADFNASEKITFNLEYMNYYDKDGTEIDGVTLGVSTRF